MGEIITLRKVWDTETGEVWRWLALYGRAESLASWGDTPQEALEEILKKING